MGGSRDVLEIIIKGRDVSGSSTIKNFKTSVQGLGKFALGAFGTLSAGALGAGVAITKMAADAGQLASIKDSFQSMTADIGVDMEQFVKDVGEASRGTLDELTILQGGTRALSLIGKDAFTDFGGQFSEMAELAKKSARATGQDVNFMFDSLITGMSRESKMILDNLGINVDLVQAKEDYAKSLGKTVDVLTTAEAKTAVMNTTLDALRETYGAVEASSGGLSGTIAQLKTTFKNAKMEIGAKFMPILTTLGGIVGELVEKYLPPFLEFVEKNITPALEIAGEVISNLASGDFQALRETLLTVFPPEFVNFLYTIPGKIEEFKLKVMEFMEPVLQWVQNNVMVKDVLIALGIAIASVVLPALWSLMGTVLSIMAPFALLVGAVVLIRKAWSENWGGIRDKLTAVWDKLRPVFEQLKAWLAENIPVALDKLKQFWDEVLFPALQKVWKFLTEDMAPVWEALAKLIGTILKKEIEILVGVWDNVLKPALQKIWEWINDKILPIFQQWMDKMGGVKGMIEKIVEWINKLRQKLENLTLPDWMTPGSPTPWELGLRGVFDAMDDLYRYGLPRLEMKLTALPASAPVPSPGRSPGRRADLSGGPNITLVYSPGVSLGTREEIQSVLDPYVDRAVERNRRSKL